ncbi:hypothetical protein [Herbidospora mongoliensis]|uniref:hypothetical protein n=1 Tax=Herbidospora mongoliensis TaxID=688067 RepID=UPI000834D864|nr:hypothetical protein [Herbidospora mongoliensis]
MDAESTICLSDLVPALRWSRPQQVAEILADPRLPGGWWGSVALGRALGTTGVDWVCERLARLAVTHLDHLPLTDFMPALQVHTVDRQLPGWPDPVRSVIIGLGGWQRLRRLTAGDLAAPSSAASPETVLTAVFQEIFAHIRIEIPADAAAQAPAPQPVQQQAPKQQPVQQPVQQKAPAQPLSAPVPAVEETGMMAAIPARGRVNGVKPPLNGTPLVSGPPKAKEPEPAPLNTAEHPMVGLVEHLFREWNQLERAVAAQRLFAAEPISLRTLAHELGVDRELLSQAQRTAEERVLMWLRSPDSAALTGHLFGLTEWLGTAATQEQLIAADASHPIEVPALRTPLWRVLVTLMPDRRLQDGWLVVGDLGGLRDRTRQLLSAHAADADVIELLGQLGIRSHSAKAWMEALPKSLTNPSSANGGAPVGDAPLPRRTPGANGHPARPAGVPIPKMAHSGPDPQTALAALNALTGGAPRPHLVPSPRSTPSPASDPRRWQRIDVTSGHLRGEPVAVPENYAAQLGMRPGTLLSVTGPGDNAVVLVWRDRQPVFDSLQPVLMRLNARPGDSVYVTVDGYRLDAQLTS